MKQSLFLLLIAGLCVTAGMGTWLFLAWTAVMDIDSVTPQTEMGGSMMNWAVSGTLLMMGGMILLHFAADLAEQTEPEEEDSV